MIYMGSKGRIAKDILPFILHNSDKYASYIEPFVGGCNLIEHVPDTFIKLGNDINFYLIDMLNATLDGSFNLTHDYYIDKELYQDIRLNHQNYPSYLVGYAGIICNFRGKWFGGYCGNTVAKQVGKNRDYQKEHLNSFVKQIEKLRTVKFTAMPYYDLRLHQPSIIYCDPPYRNTTKYKDSFDYDLFYSWCRNMKSLGHDIYVSAYLMPDDFKCIWSKEMSSNLSSNSGFKVTERLYTL